ncbi:hypothetical protein VV02_24035 [Luteipulveratus mongoliensis]|uniref:Uncharacterized protein n=1 Tax=Luteipulveratus mongoliensis TaxID=571913 RepID=A0A0K1JND1_9MICO|nr:hypothetical protein VV02_24035 [Luteipulveratus mongoliensis]
MDLIALVRLESAPTDQAPPPKCCVTLSVLLAADAGGGDAASPAARPNPVASPMHIVRRRIV